MRTSFVVLIAVIAALAGWSHAAQELPRPPMPPNAPPPQPAGEREKCNSPLMPYLSLIGPNSQTDKPAILRAAGESEWKEIWRMHVGEQGVRRSVHGDGTPEIDFSRCIVIAIFVGESWNSDGAYVEAVEDLGDVVRLRFDERTYQTAGPGGGGVKVRPYGIFVLPHTTKPIIVEENVQGLIGQPPKWKQQARFEKL